MRATFFAGWAIDARLAASSDAQTTSRRIIVIDNFPIRCREARRLDESKAGPGSSVAC